MKELTTQTGKLYEVGTLQYTRRQLAGVFFWLLLGGFAYYSLTATAIGNLMPLMAKRVAAPGWLIGGMFTSLPAVLTVVLCPILSTSSDRLRSRWGRRIPYLAVATPFIAIFGIMMGWSVELGVLLQESILPWCDAQTLGIVMIAISTVLFQIFSLFVGSVFCYIYADVIPHHLIGRFMALFNIVYAGSGVLFSFFLMKYAEVGTPWIFTGLSLFYFVCFVGVCKFVREGKYPPPEEVTTAGQSWQQKLATWLITYFRQCYSRPFFLFLFFGTALTQVSTVCRGLFNVLFATRELGLSTEEFGYVMGVGGAVSCALIYAAGYLMDKIHPIRVYIFSGFLVIALNVWGYFYTTDYRSFFVVGVLVTLIYAIQNLSCLPLFVELFPPEKFGQLSSANSIVNCVLVIFAGVIGGWFIDRFGYRSLFIWDTIFTVIATASLFVVYFRWLAMGGSKHYVPPVID